MGNPKYHFAIDAYSRMDMEANDNGTVRPLWDGLKLIGWERVS